jgi:hypothetical protein
MGARISRIRSGHDDMAVSMTYCECKNLGEAKKMETSDKSARQLYEEIKANPTRPRFGFGRKAAVINIDLQKA